MLSLMHRTHRRNRLCFHCVPENDSHGRSLLHPPQLFLIRLPVSATRTIIAWGLSCLTCLTCLTSMWQRSTTYSPGTRGVLSLVTSVGTGLEAGAQCSAISNLSLENALQLMKDDIPMDVIYAIRDYLPLTFRAVAVEFRDGYHPRLRDTEYLTAMRVRPTLRALRHYYRPVRSLPRRFSCDACVMVRYQPKFRCYVCKAVRYPTVNERCWADTCTTGVRCLRPAVQGTRLCPTHAKRPPPVLSAPGWNIIKDTYC